MKAFEDFSALVVLPDPDSAPDSDAEYSDNDAGHAERFCARWQEEIAYVPERDLWLTWEGRWKRDGNGGLVRRAIELSREMLLAAASTPCQSEEDIKRRNAAIKSAMRWGNKAVIAPMLDLSKAFLSIQIPVAKLDSDPFLVGAENAVIDLRTGESRPYSRDDYITQTLGTHFDPQATCPRWLRFMEEVFPDEEVRRYVWKAAGYSLTGEIGRAHV